MTGQATVPPGTALPLRPDEWVTDRRDEPRRHIDLIAQRVDARPTGAGPSWVWVHGHEYLCGCETGAPPCRQVLVSMAALRRIADGSRWR